MEKHPVTRLILNRAADPSDAFRYEVFLADHASEPLQKERLSILTHVPAAFPIAGQQELHLAALVRVRALLDRQILALRSA